MRLVLILVKIAEKKKIKLMRNIFTFEIGNLQLQKIF